MQKEFIEHMLAVSGSKKYSKLSVYAQLSFSMTKLMDVPRGNFRPMPKVNSALIYLKPKKREISEDGLLVIGMLMQHKKKELKNAIVDSAKQLGLSKEEAAKLASMLANKEKRVFKMSPDELLSTANEIVKLRKSS